ncbi:MAG TPA: hypothetical protein VF950_17255 [Planctomycetota bacterium]
MRPLFLLLTAGCASAPPTVELRSLDAHPATFAAMPGPGPHRGVVLVGSADAALGAPLELRGRNGTHGFLPGRSRTKVVDGVFHFTAALMETEFRACVGNVPDVALVFDGGVAAARLRAASPLQGSLGDHHPVWKDR